MIEQAISLLSTPTLLDEQKLERFNIYCDESCHLENDGHSIMVLGATWCPKADVRRLSNELSEIKSAYNAKGELKWGKVSPAKGEFYDAVVEWFVKEPNLNFRCIVVLDKQKLDHEVFNEGSHDLFYYKMYYTLIKHVLDINRKYEIYLDIKDTRSRKKVHKLRDVLSKSKYDFSNSMIVNLQSIRSHESQLMQVADFLSGAVSFKNRYVGAVSEHRPSDEKLRIIKLIENKTNVSLSRNTTRLAEKISLFRFSPRASN